MNADRPAQDADSDAAEGPHAEPGHIVQADDAAADVGGGIQLDESLRVKTDVNLIQQILGNLVDNACKYSREAEDRRIWLRAKKQGCQLVLEVEDRGPGVARRESRSIFRAFRRGHDADVTAGGVGLGLALAQRWANLVGGRLSLCSEAKVGACFRLELPL